MSDEEMLQHYGILGMKWGGSVGTPSTAYKSEWESW